MKATVVAMMSGTSMMLALVAGGMSVGVRDDETAATVVVVRMITSLAMAVTDDGARGNR